MRSILSFIGCCILWVVAVPYLVVYVTFQLVASLLELPRFIYRWLLHSPVLETEYHLPQAYALITGASDGVGKALAEELANRGWNLILHGRNPTKLDALADILRAAHPTIDTRVTVQDTTHSTSFPDLFAHNLVNLLGPITLLVNNVGTLHSAVPFCALTSDEINAALLTNIAFPTLLTHYLLSSPVRRRGSDTSAYAMSPRAAEENSPLLGGGGAKGGVQWELRCIMNISCIAGLHATAHSSVHSATKSYLTSLSRGIVMDAPAGIEILNLLIGHTRTASWRGKNSMLVQDVDACVRGCLAAVGLGKTRGHGRGSRAWGCQDILGLGSMGGRGEGVYVYWLHELWVGLERVLPGRVSDGLAAYYDGIFGREVALF
ncbi:hypothetical protein BZA05DRAFT_236776 [Tricharina praecox]|uniref:uncharacterized protein n=1 Tax=Tricharina praecox TaxID=43433 RepID=UPI0022207404|nr:uncharacterized protein BZA05DRAFT_236776 [Tricharina praecox]KAI5855312.1 hypothetical protein BZA05DRAFT_236776 [Tricharina praecox]